MIITITGTPGSGKTTIGKKLAEKLGYEFYSAGMARRKMAAEMGMTLEEFNRLGEEEDFTDKKVDEYMKNLASEKDNLVFDGKLAYFIIPDSVKVFIDADETTRAKRIFYDSKYRNQQEVKSIEEQKRFNHERMHSDDVRYKRYYGITDFSDHKNFDFILDTSEEHDPDKNAEKIIGYIRSRNLL